MFNHRPPPPTPCAFSETLSYKSNRLQCFTSPGKLPFFAGFSRSHRIKSDNSIAFFGYFPNLVTKMTTFIVFSVLKNIGLPVLWDKFRLKIFLLFSGRWSRLAKLCSVKQLTCAVPSWLGTRYTHTHTYTHGIRCTAWGLVHAKSPVTSRDLWWLTRWNTTRYE